MRKNFALMGAALLWASLTHAQSIRTTNTKDSLPTGELDPVTITANRMPQKQSQTGKVVTVIPREQIERSAGRTLAQVLNEQAGIHINGALNNLGSNQTLYMRGANNGRALVLIDGIPAYDPSLISNEFDLNLFSLNDIDRIEVCRGAHSTVYGSDAVAGVVNIITQKAAADRPVALTATGSYGNLNTFRGNLGISGTVGKLSYTARYARLRTDGFSAARDTTGTAGFDRDAFSSHAAGASLQYKASDRWTLRSYLQHNRYSTDIDAGAFVDERDFTTRSKTLMAGTGFQYRHNQLSITGNYQYSDVTRNFLNDSLHQPGFTKYMTDDYYGRNQYLELYTNIGLGQGFSLLYGIDYRFSSMNSQLFSLSSFGPFTSGFNDTSVSQASMYASLFFNHGRWNLEAGGRLNVHDRYGSQTTYTFNPSFKLNNSHRLFASIATGFKAPSLYQLYSGFGNKELKAELSQNYEAGWQYSRRRINNRFVYFYRDITNGIDFDNNQFRYFNISGQRVHGVEWEMVWNPVKAITLRSNYTWLGGRENIQSRITAKDSTYNYLLRRPAHQWNGTLQWRPAEKWDFSVSGRYISERFDAGGFRRPDVRLDSYFLAGMYASFQATGNLRFFADIQNLLNTSFTEVRGYNAIPRMVQAGVSLNW